MDAPIRILAIDDEATMLRILRRTLEPEGYQIETCSNAEDAVKLMKGSEPFDVVITDMMLPAGMDGFKVIEEAKAVDSETMVIVITAYSSVESAVAAVKAGAYDFIPKPFDPDHILIVVKRAVEAKSLRLENIGLKKRLEGCPQRKEIVGTSPAISHVFNMIEKVKDTSGTVLLIGESGVGKELVARAIHFGSGRAEKPFIAINCGALPDELLESELFGYEKGAFTGATRRKQGLLEAANNGSVFLDEVGSISPMMQVKLLRFLQEKTFMRLGSNETVAVDVRVIAATNEDLRAAVDRGAFRKDLYYRLNVIPIEIPPLRERKDDIPLLVRHFIAKFASKANKTIPNVSKETMDILVNHLWEGNVRELENVIERAVTITDDEVIGPDDLPEEVKHGAKKVEAAASPYDPNLSLFEIERLHIKTVLARTGGNKSKAARILGIDYSTLLRKLKTIDAAA